MSQQREADILRLLARVQCLDPRARQAFLRQALLEEHGDASINEEVMSRLLSNTETRNPNAETVFLAGDSTPLTEPLEGRRLGAWRLIRQLGQGGMGAVWLAQRSDASFEMSAAVKLIKREMVTKDVVARFRRERQILADLQHPNIASLIDGGTTEDGLPYLVMEYVDGVTIDGFCDARLLDPFAVLDLFRNTCEAVAYAHRKGVLHRDIKPSNIMVNHEGMVKLMDFGIATDATGSGTITGQGFGPMTPEYAPPERLKGGRATAASDIYALGLVLLRLLTGKRPSEAPGDPICLLEPPIKDTDRKIEDLLSRMLAPNASDRPANVNALILGLDEILSAGSTQYRIEKVRSGGTYDAMIWCHEEAGEELGRLTRELAEEAGLNVWLDHEAPHHPARLTAALAVSDCVLVPLSASGTGPWRNKQQAAILAEQLAVHPRRVVPILLDGAARPERESELPAFLRRKVWTHLNKEQDDAAMTSLSRIIRGLPPVAYNNNDEISCPFRGLEAFREEDRHLFFGREAVAQRLEEHLQQHRFLAVLGPSGSGKSSVVGAGLVPHLRENDATIAFFTPNIRPFEELAFALCGLLEEGGRKYRTEEVATRLRNQRETLHFLAREVASSLGKRRLVLVIDQFEELFTLAEDPEEVSQWISALLYAVEQSGGPVTVVLTLRSDFLGKCVPWPDLDDFITENMVHIKPMARADLERAITEPAHRVGLEFEPGLVEKIVDEVGQSSGGLPLLEHALLELYQRRKGRFLSWSAYEDIGGIEGALARRAEGEYLQQSEIGKIIFRKMFTLCLVHPGEGSEDTRRRATRAELLAIGKGGEEAEALLDGLIERRLLTGFRDDIRGLDLVDVAHEALIRRWERIRTWMDEDRETARQLNRLRRSAQAWHLAERDEDHLPRGGPLYQVRELLAEQGPFLGQIERDFVHAAIDRDLSEIRAKEKVTQHLRRRQNLAVGASIVALLLALLSLALLRGAVKNADRAIREVTARNQAMQLADAKTYESNHNLTLMFSEKVTQELTGGVLDQALLYGLKSLTTTNGEPLPQAIGQFAHPKMLEASRLLWNAPKTASAYCAAFSPDNLYLAVNTAGSVRLFLRDSGMEVGCFSGAGSLVRLAFSPDGQSIAGAGSNGRLFLWRLSPAADPLLPPETLFNGYPKHITGLVFHPNNTTLFTSSEDGAVMRWDLPTGRSRENAQNISIMKPLILSTGQSRQIFHRDTPILDLALSPSGTFLAIATKEAALVLDVGTEQPVACRDGVQDVSALCFLNDDQLVFADSSCQPRLMDLGTGRTENRFGGNTQPIQDMVMFPALDLLVISAVDDSLRAFEISSGRLRWEQCPPNDDSRFAVGYRDLAGSRDGLLAVSGGRQGTVMLDPATGIQLGSFAGFGNAITSVASSPDNRLFASTGQSPEIQLWDSASGLPIKTFRGQTDLITHIAFSPDGQSMAGSSSDKTVILYDTATHAYKHVLVGHKAPVLHVSFSPDSQKIISSSSDRTARVWSVKTGALLRELKGHGKAVNKAVFINNAQAVTISGDGITRHWRLKDGATLHTFGSLGGSPVIALAHHGKLIATGMEDTSIRVWDLETRFPYFLAKAHRGSVGSLSFSPDGRFLAGASDDQTIALWDISARRAMSPLTGHRAPVKTVSFFPDSRRLLSGDTSGSLRLWEVSVPRPWVPDYFPDDVIHDIGISEDGRRLSVLLARGIVKTYQMPSAGLQSTFTLSTSKTQAGPFPAGKLSQNGNAFVLSGKTLGLAGILPEQTDQRVMLTPEVSRESEPADPLSEAHRLEISPNGRYSAMTTEMAVYLLDAERGESQVIAGQVEVALFSPNNRFLAAGMFKIGLWSLPECKLVREQDGHDMGIRTMAFSPNGRNLVTAGADQTVKVWAMPDLVHRHTLLGHSGNVRRLAVSSRLVATIGDDQTLKIWNLADGKRMSSSSVSGQAITIMTFSPDGRKLITGDLDGNIRIWRTFDGKLEALIKGGQGDIRALLISPGGEVLTVLSGKSSVRFWYLDQLEDLRIPEAELLLDRAKDFFSLTFEGPSLRPGTQRFRLVGVDGMFTPDPFEALVRPRPLDVSLLPWLAEAGDGSKPALK